MKQIITDFEIIEPTGEATLVYQIAAADFREFESVIESLSEQTEATYN